MSKWLMTALLVVAATAAQAQTKKELVQRLIELQRPAVEGLARAVAGQTSSQALGAARQPLARLPEERRDAVAKQLQADVRAYYDEVEPLLRKRAVELAPSTLGATFEERFSEEELKQLIAWYESPIAKKYQQVAPELQAGLMQRLLADTRPTVESKLRSLRETMGKRFADAAPGAPASAPQGGK